MMDVSVHDVLNMSLPSGVVDIILTVLYCAIENEKTSSISHAELFCKFDAMWPWVSL